MSDYMPTTEQVRGWYSEGRYAFYPRINNPHSEFDAWLAAHDAAIRADEREKAALEAIVRAFKVMRAHEFMVRSILSKEDEPDSEQAAKAVVAYLIHAVDMDAENAAAARGDGAE